MTMRREYRRTKVLAAESAELWERWKKGEGLHAIGQALGRGHTSVFGHIRPSGGIKPPARRRSMRALTMVEREEISRGIVEGRSVRAIARALGRSASTVSREIRRNGGSRRYRAEAADKLAWKRALRPKLCKMAICGQLRQAVAVKLKRNWSPEQIAGWLKRTHPANEARRVSHETIYRSLYVQTRGVLKQELMAYLRSQRLFRRSRHATQK
jgi:IS30 family transposase